MNKLRNTLVIAAMVVGSSAFAHNDTSLTIFPDYGAWRESSRMGQQRTGQKVRLASLTPASTQGEEGAAALRERQLKAKLEALGIAVD